MLTSFIGNAFELFIRKFTRPAYVGFVFFGSLKSPVLLLSTGREGRLERTPTP